MQLDFGSFQIRQTAYPPGLRQPRHFHEHSNVTIVVAGPLHEASDGGEYTARPWSVVVKAGGGAEGTFLPASLAPQWLDSIRDSLDRNFDQSIRFENSPAISACIPSTSRARFASTSVSR